MLSNFLIHWYFPCIFIPRLLGFLLVMQSNWAQNIFGQKHEILYLEKYAMQVSDFKIFMQ